MVTFSRGLLFWNHRVIRTRFLVYLLVVNQWDHIRDTRSYFSPIFSDMN